MSDELTLWAIAINQILIQLNMDLNSKASLGIQNICCQLHTKKAILHLELPPPIR